MIAACDLPRYARGTIIGALVEAYGIGQKAAAATPAAPSVLADLLREALAGLSDPSAYYGEGRAADFERRAAAALAGVAP